MVNICFYFQVHQPFRVRRYSVFDIGNTQKYFDESRYMQISNEQIMKKVASKCYLPANRAMLDLLREHPEFKISYSISGTALEQFEAYAPEVIDSFRELVATGRVEMLDETHYHSLSFLYNLDEFKAQVKLHRETIQRLFGVTPKVFRNTELVFNNSLAREVSAMGYTGILAEGVDRVLDWRSPAFTYTAVSAPEITVLLKNYRLSDDIAFRFSERSWSEWPLTSEKFTQWVNAVNGNGHLVNLFMDYETFGEHQWKETGIFDFLRALPREILKHPDNHFVTPSEAVAQFKPAGEIDMHHFYSWADVERDLSAWLGNPMQHAAIEHVYALGDAVLRTGDEALISDWRKLQTSDHFYYMCTKWFSDGDVHKYFNPYDTPYEAFVNYMNVLADLRVRVNAQLTRQTLTPIV
jgi:alpha-amylase